jgi:hypothetical protein
MKISNKIIHTIKINKKIKLTKIYSNQLGNMIKILIYPDKIFNKKITL